ncbi:hypothetical protein N658DRAFT_541653, partial [Parathielavia hyrcaniae]
EKDVLRSEVAAPVGLLEYQLRRGDFCQHQALTALVFSLHHKRFHRITQFHFDGQSLMLRQSRLIKLSRKRTHGRCIPYESLDGQPPNGRNQEMPSRE